MKRAQLCADSSETASCLLFLADLYAKIGDIATAATYHRQCVDVSQKLGKHLGEYAKSSIFAARYEIDLAANRGQASMPSTEVPNLQRAKQLLEPFAGANVEETPAAEELNRRLRQLGVA